jgi:hypothetical protein
MSRGSDPAKVKQWTQRFERFGKSGQSVTQFCEAEGISTPSFYHWRQKLGRTANGRKGVSQSTRRRASRPAAFKPVDVVLPGRPFGMTIHLPDGIVIELGNDLATVETVMRQLLDRPGSGQRWGS